MKLTDLTAAVPTIKLLAAAVSGCLQHRADRLLAEDTLQDADNPERYRSKGLTLETLPVLSSEREADQAAGGSKLLVSLSRARPPNTWLPTVLRCNIDAFESRSKTWLLDQINLCIFRYMYTNLLNCFLTLGLMIIRGTNRQL